MLNKVLHHVRKYPQNSFSLYILNFNSLVNCILSFKFHSFRSAIITSSIFVANLCNLNNLRLTCLGLVHRTVCFLLMNDSTFSKIELELFTFCCRHRRLFFYFLKFTHAINYFPYIIDYHDSNTDNCMPRILELMENKIALLIAGIESNPGPIDCPELITSFDIITVNCNGLTSDVRLLQAIGKLKKNIKTGKPLSSYKSPIMQISFF